MFHSIRQPSIPFVKETSSLVVAQDAIEIRIFWGGALLDVVELCPPRAFFVGDGSRSKLPVDFTVPDAGFERAPLVIVEHGEYFGVGTRRARPPFFETSRCTKTRGRPNPWRESVPLGDATIIDVRLGDLTFSLRLGAREARCPRTLVGDADVRPFAFFGVAALLGAAFLGSLAFFTPPLGLTDDEDLDRDRLFLIQQYLDASGANTSASPTRRRTSPRTRGAVDAPAEKARGEAGKIGRRDVTAQNLRASGTEAGEHLRPATSRAEEISQAATFGVIGLLSSGATAALDGAPWDDSGIGQMAVAGGFFGTEIGEVGGLNGLALGGPGEGGGGPSNQIGLASIGTCHGEECGVGRSRDRGRVEPVPITSRKRRVCARTATRSSTAVHCLPK